jgi:hypothetical protein
MAIMPEVETRFSAVADQAAEQEGNQRSEVSEHGAEGKDGADDRTTGQRTTGPCWR